MSDIGGHFNLSKGLLETLGIIILESFQQKRDAIIVFIIASAAVLMDYKGTRAKIQKAI